MDKSLLYKYFKGDASPSERKAIRTWVEASADHYDEYIRERKLFDASLLLSPHEVRRPLKVRLMRLGRMSPLLPLHFLYWAFCSSISIPVLKRGLCSASWFRWVSV